jgi:exodeoxyribonuclease VII large subunit
VYRLGLAARTLQSLSPLATLDRGYAIVAAADGKILRSSGDTQVGDTLDVRLSRGTVRADVTALDPDDAEQ